METLWIQAESGLTHEQYNEIAETAKDAFGEYTVVLTTNEIETLSPGEAQEVADQLIDALENNCDECGSGGGGLCPECKDKAEIH